MSDASNVVTALKTVTRRRQVAASSSMQQRFKLGLLLDHEDAYLYNFMVDLSGWERTELSADVKLEIATTMFGRSSREGSAIIGDTSE